MANADDVRRLALALPHVVEIDSEGFDFRVADKGFVWSYPERRPGKPRVIRGLTADKKGWTRVDEKLKDVSIRSVGVYHDDQRGATRGLDTVFIFEVGGVRIAHLGDLGHVLNDQQLAAIGAVDVLLVPVGGTFTIDGLTATHVVEQLRPRIMVIPMHYKTDASTIKELEPLALFLDGKRNVRHERSNTIALSPMKARPAAEIVVLRYR